MIFIKNIIIMFVKKIRVFYYVDHCHALNPKIMKILFLHDNTTCLIGMQDILTPI
jgi:hypothetical protein